MHTHLTGVPQAMAIRRWPSEWQRGTGVLAAFAVVFSRWSRVMSGGVLPPGPFS